MTRREVLALISAVPFATRQLVAADGKTPLYFSTEEFQLLDTLVELIIPADDHSPGAHAAGVAAYIDRTTAEAFNPDDRTSWNQGLAKINSNAQEKFGTSFLKADKDKQVSLLKAMDSANDPFFGQLKQSTAFAYYSSDIGIHKDIEYKGNVILEQFVGYLP